MAVEDLLFGPETTYVEVKCWSCGHVVTRTLDQVPTGITGHEFEKRAICQCGTRWPQVTKYPRKKATTM